MHETLHNICAIGTGATVAAIPAVAYSPTPSNSVPLILGLLTVVGQIINQILIRKNAKKNELQAKKAV